MLTKDCKGLKMRVNKQRNCVKFVQQEITKLMNLFLNNNKNLDKS